MSQGRRWLSGAYFALAAIALVTCWRQNLAFMGEGGASLAEGFVAFWPALLVNHATTSITIDIFLFGLAASIWMVLEARRLGMRWVWLYVFFGWTIAISVTFPIFLAMRERKLHETSGPEPSAQTADLVGLGLFAAGIVGFALWTLTR